MELNLLVQNSVQQNYLTELYTLYPTFYQECINSFHLACSPYHIWTSLPLPPNLPFERNPADRGRIPSSRKKVSISRTRKILLTKQQFPCNHLIQTSFIAVVIAVASFFFLTSGFMYRYIMLILISWGLSAAWQKHWMIKISPSKIPRSSLHLSMLFGKPCFNYCLF